MDFIKNNLSILTTILALIISGIFNFYQYFENRKFKKYAREKDLKRREASLERLRNDYKNYKAFESYKPVGLMGKNKKKENEVRHREKEILAEIEYLKKILKIKNN